MVRSPTTKTPTQVFNICTTSIPAPTGFLYKHEEHCYALFKIIPEMEVTGGTRKAVLVLFEVLKEIQCFRYELLRCVLVILQYCINRIDTGSTK